MLGAILISLPQIRKAQVHSKEVQDQITLITLLSMARRREKVETGSPVLEWVRIYKSLDSGIDRGTTGGSAKSEEDSTISTCWIYVWMSENCKCEARETEERRMAPRFLVWVTGEMVVSPR